MRTQHTGKTYVTYATYALLAKWRGLVEWTIPNTDMRSLHENGVLKVNLQDNFVAHWDEIRKKTSEKWKAYLPFALATPEQRFVDTTLSFEIPLTD